MDNQFTCFPPRKRFKLLQIHHHNPHSKITGNSRTSPSRLPAKKRKQCPKSPSPPPSSTSLCLPAKKRIWALHPFDLDLNLEYKPPSDEKNHSNEYTDEKNHSDEGTDDGIVCGVCSSTDGDPSDPIVLCDGCDLMVHASCYGHPFTKGIPEGDWFCSQCLESKQNPAKKFCCLCPITGGAMKMTTDGRWAHLVCAIYVPEVFFVDSEGREGINCDEVLKRRWEKECYVCESMNGCVIDCSEMKCKLRFHVGCGLKEELCVEYREGKNGGGVVAAFCRAHTDLWKKQKQTGKFKIVARDE